MAPFWPSEHPLDLTEAQLRSHSEGMKCHYPQVSKSAGVLQVDVKHKAQGADALAEVIYLAFGLSQYHHQLLLNSAEVSPLKGQPGLS